MPLPSPHFPSQINAARIVLASVTANGEEQQFQRRGGWLPPTPNLGTLWSKAQSTRRLSELTGLWGGTRRLPGTHFLLRDWQRCPLSITQGDFEEDCLLMRSLQSCGEGGLQGAWGQEISTLTPASRVQKEQDHRKSPVLCLHFSPVAPSLLPIHQITTSKKSDCSWPVAQQMVLRASAPQCP